MGNGGKQALPLHGASRGMNQDPTDVTQMAYDATASRYFDRWHHVDPLIQAKERFACLLPAGGTVLDVGCGTGRDLVWFERAGFRVIGLDRSLGMLRKGPTGRRVLQVDMRRIPLSEATVDGFWASASLLHLPRTELTRALHELRRVSVLGAVGFLSMKQGLGETLEPVDGGPHRRFFCYWEAEALDQVISKSQWRIEGAWQTLDSMGRRPWLTRVLRRTH